MDNVMKTTKPNEVVEMINTFRTRPELLWIFKRLVAMEPEKQTEAIKACQAIFDKEKRP